MRKSVTRTIATGAVAAALVLGGAGVVAATTGAALPGATHAASSTPAPGAGGDSHDQETAIVGTIAAPPEADEATEKSETAAEETAREAAETKALEALATVTPDEAKAAAVKVVPGTVNKVELDEEDGFVVYEVEVTAADGTVTEVIIDAGNGSVLAQETEDANEANEADETTESANTIEAPEVGDTSTVPAK